MWVPTGGAFYRAIYPLQAMVERGHEIVWPSESDGNSPVQRLTSCDVVHVFRRSDREAQQAIKTLRRAGVGITYDNDDNLAAVPREHPDYQRLGGIHGQRAFAASVRVAKVAAIVTATNERLAARYRQAGVPRVEVIPNYVAGGIERPRARHRGIVIGWIAGGEHQADVERLPIREALERVLDAHDDVRVECIGVDLGLSRRYSHDEYVRFEELPARIGGFDIGIAPLSDSPMNRARSDIKVKEYAASAVPWLASNVGPYVGLGEDEGGRLVEDDAWFAELDRLVRGRRERKRLGRKAAAWAKTQTVERAADRWETVFAAAAAG